MLPIARMYEVIEGGAVAAHGTRHMPYDPDAYVRVRILSLVDYVNRIQAK